MIASNGSAFVGSYGFHVVAVNRAPENVAASYTVVDPATGASLVGSNVAIYGAAFASLGSFTVPASGSFLIRVHVYGSYGYGVGETSYEFFVKRGP